MKHIFIFLIVTLLSLSYSQDAAVLRRKAIRDSLKQAREVVNPTPAPQQRPAASGTQAATFTAPPPVPVDSLGELPIKDSVMIANLNVKDTEIRDLLQGLAVQYGLNLFLEPEVRGPVTVNFTNQPLKDALRILVVRNGYTYGVDHGVITIRKPQPVLQQAPKEPLKRFEIVWKDSRLDLDIEKAPLDKIVRELIEKTGKNIVTEPGLNAEVSIFLKDVEFDKGLRLLANGHKMALKEDEGIYTLIRDTWIPGDASSSKSGGQFRIEITENALVSVEAADAPLASLVANLFAQAKMNTMVYGKLEGNVTAKMEKIPLRESLKYLLRGTSYTYWERGGVYFIGPHEMQTADNSLLIRLKHMRAEDVVKLLPTTLTKGTQIQVVRAQNALMAVGSYDVLDAISQYVEKMDLPVPQILIEALVVDLDMEKARSYGLDLLLGDASKVKSAETLYPGMEQVLNRAQSQSVLDKVGIGDVIKLPKNFVAKVQAMEQEKILNVKARSQIATLNGETAVLTIGQTQYFLLKSETDYNQGDAVTAKTTERFEKVEANSNLTVTPYVTGKGEVTCEIVPDFSEPEGSFSSSVPPTLNKRYVKSSVRLRNGETIVLGGMVKESVNNINRQVPFLGSIPVLGWLFKNVEQVKSRSQLLIFVTPTIYYGEEGSVNVEEVLKRLEK